MSMTVMLGCIFYFVFIIVVIIYFCKERKPHSVPLRFMGFLMFFFLRPAVILYTKDELILIFKCHVKKKLFFTLDPVAALAYNRTDRYGGYN